MRTSDRAPSSTLPVRALPDGEAPPHRPLAEGWQVWSVVEVRSAGFSADRLAPFRAERAVAAAEDALDQRRAADLASASFLDAAARLRGQPLDEEARRALVRALTKVRRARPAADPSLPAPLASLASALDERRARARQASARVIDALDDERKQWARACRALLGADDFRRALAWQNPSALSGALAALQRRSLDDTSSQTRKGELLALSYLQRYATKNDTVGFFGPVAWATLDDATTPLRQRPGARLLASSSVQLEPWAVDALARALLSDEELLPHLFPSLAASARLSGSALSGVGRSLLAVRELDELERSLLERVDGRTSALDIAARAAAHGDVNAQVSAERALACLLSLRRQGLVRFSLPVQITDAPEQALLMALHDMPGEVPAVQRARERAARLCGATSSLRAALEPAGALEAAVSSSNACFQAVTGTAPERRPGEMYACRTPFLLNCRRDLELTFGGVVVERLSPLLTPVLGAARWFSYEVARGFQALLANLYETRRHGRASVPLVEIYRALIPLFAHGRPAFLTRASHEVQRRLTQALGPLSGSRVHVDEGTFAARMRESFDAPQPGFPSARHHSPDVLLAADGEDAFREGRFTPVLGEVHAGINTLAVLQAVTQSPRPGVLAALQRRDVPSLIVELQHDSYALCAQDSLLGDGDVHFDTGAPWRSWLGTPPLRLGDLDVVREDGFLRASDRATGWRGELLQVLERVLKLNATTELKLTTSGAHRPRVLVGGAVLQREGWELPKDAFAPLVDTRGAERFVAARALRRDLDLPPMVFARVPREPKPVFVDLRSPLSVDVLARACRGAETLSLSEALPSLDELWLRDDAGRRHVAELRMVAVDPVAWRPIPLEPAVDAPA